MKFCSAFLLWITLSIELVNCAPDGGHGGAWIHGSQQIAKRGEMQYCGFRLVEAIRNLCQGNYAALTRRSDPALLASKPATKIRMKGNVESVGGVLSPAAVFHFSFLFFWLFQDAGSYEEESKNGVEKLFPPSLNSEYSPLQQDLEADNWEPTDNAVPTDFETLWPKSPKALAMRILGEGPSHRRLRRSVSDECCKRPCGVRTMLKYCGGLRQWDYWKKYLDTDRLAL